MCPMMTLYISKFVKIIHKFQSFEWGQGRQKKQASKHKHTQQHGDILRPSFLGRVHKGDTKSDY